MTTKKILLATSLLGVASAAHAWIHALAEGDDVEVILLHVDEWATVGFHESSELIEYYDRVKQSRSQLMETEAQLLRDRGVPVRLLTADGTPAWHILDVASELDVDLIVMTRSPVDDARKLLLGSTARRVCRHSKVPVFAVAPGDGTAPRKIRRVLTTTDFSRDSIRGMREVNLLARRFGAHVTALHVCRAPWLLRSVPQDLRGVPAEFQSGLQSAAETRLTEHLRELELDFEPMVRTGDVAACVAAAAVESGADLIAIPSHGYGVARAAFGSATEAVLAKAATPVLVLPRVWVNDRQERRR